MDSSTISSIWNAPGSRPMSRTATASNGFNTPPKRLISPASFGGNTALRNATRSHSPGWNLGGSATADPFVRPTSSNLGRLTDVSGDAGITHDEMWKHYRLQQSLRLDENDFMLNLLCRIDQLQAQVNSHSSVDENSHALQGKAEAEKSALTDRVQRLEDRLRRSENLLALDPFVLVLIDGDHLLFDDELVSHGELGGERAASQLDQHIRRYISGKLAHVPSSSRIEVKIFSDTKGLAQIYSCSGLVQDVSRVGDFQRAFSRANVNYNWVDVGRDFAKTKIQNGLMTHLQDPHCRHVLIGCSRDAGEKQILKPLLDGNNDTFDLVTLIGTRHSKDDIESSNFRSTDLDNFFRAQNISFLNAVGEPHRYPSPPISRSNSEAPTSRTNSAAGMKENMFSAQPLITASKNPIPLSWASTVKKPAPPLANLGHDKSTEPVLDVEIPRNRNGQRIDPVIKHDKDEVERVKKMKLCNVHFLRQECPHGDDCTHVHRARPTASTLKYLALVARMAPCMYGSWCEDHKCIYGHVCSAPEGRYGELCIFADQCRFPKELHKVDRTVVKTTKI